MQLVDRPPSDRSLTSNRSDGEAASARTFGRRLLAVARAKLFERASIGGEVPAFPRGLQCRQTFRSAALRKDVFDPGPLGARRAHVGTAAKAATKAIEPPVDDVDARKGLAVE